MVPNDIHRVLGQLAPRRPLFHSEADFQHELAWELRLMLHGADVRVERPLGKGERMNVDLVVRHGGDDIAIELKYWPRKWEGRHAGEEFALRERGAQDLGRYDYWKDVGRVERLVRDGLVAWGAAIGVTNDSAYWSTPRAGTMAEPFALHEGRREPATLAWPRMTGTTKGRTEPIALTRPYDVRWLPFGHGGAWLPLRYVALVVPPQG